MSSIVTDLMKQITTGNNLSTIAKSVGGDEKGVQSALSMGLPLLMGSMAKTASKPEGSSSIMNMVTQVGASNPLDNFGSFLGKPEASGDSNMLNMLLGNNMGAVQNSISQKSGLTSSVVSKLLAMVVPMLMGSIGKMFVGGNMDAKGLSSLLGEQSKAAMQASPDLADMASQLLGPEEKSGGLLGGLKKRLSF